MIIMYNVYCILSQVECEDILDMAISTLSDTSTSTIIPLTFNESNGLLNIENPPPPLCCDPWVRPFHTFRYLSRLPLTCTRESHFIILVIRNKDSAFNEKRP